MLIVGNKYFPNLWKEGGVMYSKLHLSIGNKEMNVQLNGMDRLHQIQSMKSLVIGFFDELEKEVTLEEKAISEAQEMRNVARALGLNEEQFHAISEAYSKLDPQNMERQVFHETLIQSDSPIELVTNQLPTPNQTKDEHRENEVKTTVEHNRGRTKINTTINSLLKHQTYYICPDCNNRGKHFVLQGTPFVNCHECGKEMTLKAAASGQFPHKDIYGNTYIAGKYIRSDKYEHTWTSMATKEKEDKQIASGE